MAVVFISPKQRQRIFLEVIVLLMLLFFIGFAYLVFLSQPPQVSVGPFFNQNSITINTNIFDSQQFKNLSVFPEMTDQFSYTATDSTGKTVSGFIGAGSQAEAESLLQAQGLKGITVQDTTVVGRENPFTPYVPTTNTSASVVTPTPNVKK